MLFACFPFLHMPLHGMAGRGGVYVPGLPGFLYLDLSMNGVHVALTTRVHVKSWFRNALLTRVHLKFSSCSISRVVVEPGCRGYHLLYFPANQEAKTEKVLILGGCRSLLKFEHAVARVVFGHL